MGTNRSHNTTSDQWVKAFPVTDLDTKNFKLPGDEPFNLDNENDEDLWLEVKLEEMDDFILKRIRSGYNPLLIKEIKLDAAITVDQMSKLKGGY